MRQLKYFIKGQKGSIEVTKGTFLNLKRNNSNKISKKKIIVQTRGDQHKKLYVKQIKSNIKICKTINLNSKSECEKEKSCPNTAESLRSRDQEHILPVTSEFCIFGLNQIKQTRKIAISDSNLNQTSKKVINAEKIETAQKRGADMQYLKSENMIVNEDIYNENNFQQHEQSSWSMINDHIQQIKMTLSLGYFDFMYGKGKIL